MLRKVPDAPTDLATAAKALQQARDALTGYENTALAAVAESLSVTATTLHKLQDRIEKGQPEEWMTPERAARYLGFPSVGAFERVVAKEGVPKRYLSDRLPRYSRAEMDAWLRSR